jgi:alpha-ketoglutarate-dependent taurine dioxygenase
VIGAEIEGVDVAAELSNQQFSEVHRALLELQRRQTELYNALSPQSTLGKSATGRWQFSTEAV